MIKSMMKKIEIKLMFLKETAFIIRSRTTDMMSVEVTKGYKQTKTPQGEGQEPTDIEHSEKKLLQS
jgi:hypothetical protein